MTIKKIAGTIYQRYGEEVKGTMRLEDLKVERREYPRTCVEWGSSLPQEGALEGKFTFYGDLPEEVRGKYFVLKETIDAQNIIPVRQVLQVHSEGYCKIFTFIKDKTPKKIQERN